MVALHLSSLDNLPPQGASMPVTESSVPALSAAIRRALVDRCPNCGTGALFKSYLKQIDQCAICTESYRNIRADDGPAWLTILLVGHVIVPLILMSNVVSWPLWLAMSVWPVATALVGLMELPRAKGVFLAIIWSAHASGSENN